MLVVVSAAACSKPAAPRPPVQRAFYWWRTVLNPSPRERDILRQLSVRRLYVRYFDVDLAGEPESPVPVAPVDGAAEGLPDGIDVVPVVFIRERVFRAPAPRLAAHVWAKIRAISQQLGVTVHEVQLDCDWTPGSRDAYFEFLRSLRELARSSGVELAATIRLHQVKFRERTGVPPVGRGMLMFYNMGRIGPDEGQHAIFDAAAAARYVERIADYPLPLDVALPIWSWVVQVRAGRIRALLQTVDPAQIEANADPQAAFVRIGNDRWRATRDTHLGNTFIQADDELQADTVGPSTTLAAARLVSAHLGPASVRTVSLFALSEGNLDRYGNQDLEQLFALPY